MSIPIEYVPAKFIHQKGPNKGNLRLNDLQLPNAKNLRCGDEHPLCSEIIFLQINKKTGKQQWTTKNRDEWRKQRNSYSSLRHYYNVGKNNRAMKGNKSGK